MFSKLKRSSSPQIIDLFVQTSAPRLRPFAVRPRFSDASAAEKGVYRSIAVFSRLL